MPVTQVLTIQFHNKHQSHATLADFLFQLQDHFDQHLVSVQIFWRQMMPELFQSTTAAERIPRL
jgi:hypothetical protein